MYDQLVKMVQEKTGISHEQAQTAVTTVIGFLKERLPEPASSMIDNALKSDAGGMMGQAQGLLGGLFGEKKS